MTSKFLVVVLILVVLSACSYEALPTTSGTTTTPVATATPSPVPPTPTPIPTDTPAPSPTPMATPTPGGTPGVVQGSIADGPVPTAPPNERWSLNPSPTPTKTETPTLSLSELWQAGRFEDALAFLNSEKAAQEYPQAKRRAWAYELLLDWAESLAVNGNTTLAQRKLAEAIQLDPWRGESQARLERLTAGVEIFFIYPRTGGDWIARSASWANAQDYFNQASLGGQFELWIGKKPGGILVLPQAE